MFTLKNFKKWNSIVTSLTGKWNGFLFLVSFRNEEYFAPSNLGYDQEEGEDEADLQLAAAAAEETADGEHQGKLLTGELRLLPAAPPALMCLGSLHWLILGFHYTFLYKAKFLPPSPPFEALKLFLYMLPYVS